MPRLRIPICAPQGRRLRVLIYARYSTEEQHHSSIEDQINYCKELLASYGITDANADIEVRTDREMSGELASRPGINEVRAGVDARRWDIIVVEDSSRLYRHETACGELIETAVDNGIRVICINDDVDTGDDDWEDPLHEAMRHHARSNRYVSKRIKRKLDGLWRQGAAIGQLRPGYKRVPTRPATEHEPAQGPFFDELDSNWSPTVYEAYERIARLEPAWMVAKWLTEQGLPKCESALTKEWTDRNVLPLIQRTVYRGVEQYRVTVVRKRHRSGAHPQVRNAPDNILSREMPHLRIVPDWLWYAANKAIADRKLCAPPPRGLDHPLTGVPRDSRGPLSGLFFCGACGGKMYLEGRVEGGYRCSNAPKGLCWNKATASSQMAHVNIGRAIRDRFLSFDGVLDAILEEIPRRLVDEEPLKKKLEDLKREEAQDVIAMERLVQAVEKAKGPVEVLAVRLRDREADLARIRGEMELVRGHLDDRAALPTREELLAAVAAMVERIPTMDRETGALLKQLVSPIMAVPYQQFGSNLVVLRAKFELRFVGLLPAQWQALFRGVSPGSINGPVATTALTVDLFKRSAGPAHHARALELSVAGKTLVEIGQELGIAKRQAHIAVQYGRELKAAGLSDPYLELQRPPAAASRWRTHAQFKEAE